MASRGGDAAVSRIRTAAASLTSDNQSLIADIRKSLSMMKEIAVDLERENESEKVKDLEKTAAELLDSYEKCAHYAAAVESVANRYMPGEELTDFDNLLEAEFVNHKSRSTLTQQNHPIMRQFREAVWNVHHAGQAMPGEEQEDILMTSTQSTLLNVTCPLSGKPVTELADPVRSQDCKHVYDKAAIKHHIQSHGGQARCPIAGCPKILRADKVVRDPLLLVEIDEMRAMSKQTAGATVIEDFTQIDPEASEDSSSHS